MCVGDTAVFLSSSKFSMSQQAQGRGSLPWDCGCCGPEQQPQPECVDSGSFYCYPSLDRFFKPLKLLEAQLWNFACRSTRSFFELTLDPMWGHFKQCYLFQPCYRVVGFAAFSQYPIRSCTIFPRLSSWNLNCSLGHKMMQNKRCLWQFKLRRSLSLQ